LAAAFFGTSMLLTLLATHTERAPSMFDTPASAPSPGAPQAPAPGGAPGATQPAPSQPRGGVLDKLAPPAPTGPRVPQSQ
jgi:preprotein translocase subunit SecG